MFIVIIAVIAGFILYKICDNKVKKIEEQQEIEDKKDRRELLLANEHFEETWAIVELAGLPKEKDFDSAVKLTKDGAYGDGIDMKRVNKLLQQNYPWAYYCLGYLYYNQVLKTNSPEEKDKKAVEAFKFCEKLSPKMASVELGYAYFQGEGGCREDYKKSLEYFRNGRTLYGGIEFPAFCVGGELGTTYPANTMGHYFFNKKDYERAFQAFALSNSHLDSKRMMGYMYKHGLGVEKDLAKSEEWYRLGRSLPLEDLYFRRK